MTVRGYIYRRTLEVVGLDDDFVYANGAPDSPESQRFAVLRWGPEVPGLGGQRDGLRSRDAEVSLWLYDRDRDFSFINAALKKWEAVMDGVEAVRTGDGPRDGYISSTSWQGSSDDTWDDVYEAWVRSTTYRIVANGD